MNELLQILSTANKSDFTLGAIFLVAWPILGHFAMIALKSNWITTPLAKILSWARNIGVAFASTPKTAILKALFSPLIYLLVMGIAVLMALTDGLLSKSDSDTQSLAQVLISALKKAGARDHLSYLEQKPNLAEAAEKSAVVLEKAAQKSAEKAEAKAEAKAESKSG